LVQVKYACDLNGFDGLVITKLDVLSGLDSVPVCTEYIDGKPVYKNMKGWGNLKGLGSRSALPREVTAYLELVEEFAGVPVSMFSTSPHRDDTYGEVKW
jgi:adenylosuccinate synthase